MSIFGVFLVCIFPHSDWLPRDTPYLHIQSTCGKIRTRKTPNTDTFHAVLNKYNLQRKKGNNSLLDTKSWYVIPIDVITIKQNLIIIEKIFQLFMSKSSFSLYFQILKILLWNPVSVRGGLGEKMWLMFGVWLRFSLLVCLPDTSFSLL